MNNNFKSAQKIDLYDAAGNRLQQFKGIANTLDNKEVYTVVSPEYKIVQHDTVVDIVNQTNQELDLNCNTEITELNNGARINVKCTFPDLVAEIAEGDKVNMTATFQNSYNSTTGLRLDVGAYRWVCPNGLFSGDRHATFYARHTKGIDVAGIKRTLEKGIQCFKDKIVGSFQDMILRPLTPGQALIFIDDCINKKVMAAKYLEDIKSVIQWGGGIDIKTPSDIKNQWMLYNLVFEVITHKVKSMDMARNYGQLMLREMKKMK